MDPSDPEDEAICLKVLQAASLALGWHEKPVQITRVSHSKRLYCAAPVIPKAIRGNSLPYTLFAWYPGILVRPGKYNVRAQYPTFQLPKLAKSTLLQPRKNTHSTRLARLARVHRT